MFNGRFHESETQKAILEAIDGVVSERSLERLVLWLHTGLVELDTSDPTHRISSIIELARFFDMPRRTDMLATNDDAMGELFTSAILDKDGPPKLTPEDVGYIPYTWQQAMNCVDTGLVELDTSDPTHRISSTIELARFFDMVGISAIENELATNLSSIIAASHVANEAHTEHITAEHVCSTAKLPEWHPVYVKMTKGVAAGITNSGVPTRLVSAIDLCPTFGMDIRQGRSFEALRAC
ncbi:unnamed protein product [Penicillium bialowiezense]